MNNTKNVVLKDRPIQVTLAFISLVIVAFVMGLLLGYIPLNYESYESVMGFAILLGLGIFALAALWPGEGFPEVMSAG